MSLFGRESEARRYLRSAPAGTRKDLLAVACLNQITRLPIAAPSEWGEPVTDVHGLPPAADVVRSVLRQDASMYAWVARTAMILLDSALTSGDGDWAATLALALESVGFAEGPALRTELRERLSEHVRERVDGLCRYSMNIFWVVAQPQLDDGKRDRQVYRHLFEDPDPRTVETAHDVTAWACVIVARLRGRGLIEDSHLYSDAYLTPPEMDVAGWYPNPYNHGSLVRGEPEFQRFWDGDDWTDRVRFRTGGFWDEQSKPLRSMPNN
jgi:hypothetical protein